MSEAAVAAIRHTACGLVLRLFKTPPAPLVRAGQAEDNPMPEQQLSKEPVWGEPIEMQGDSLRGASRTDVCVIGAGIAGLTTAYLLAREGTQVIVLDSGAVGSGETGRTTAHLASALDDRFIELEKLHGAEGARLAAQSHAEAIDEIGRIVRDENIDCHYLRLDGYLFVPPGEPVDLLHHEFAAAKRAGLECELVDRAPIAGYETGDALRFFAQGQFHPGRYIAGLARAIVRMGGTIHTQTHVTEVKDGEPVQVITQAGAVVNARAAVVATNTPVIDRFTMHTKQAAYRTYAIAAPIPADAVTPALYWDTSDPYHYVRLEQVDEQTMLIVGGEDHKTGQDQNRDHFRALETWARERWPRMDRPTVHWSGQVLEPVDSLAYLGRNPGERNVYIATGDSGHGMTHGTIAGILIRDLILNRPNPWTALYDPGDAIRGRHCPRLRRRGGGTG
jgi:glycine/D-amino acid oxidase-like deaminating enzyme